MNYGKDATEKKLRDASSKKRKIANRFFLGFTRTLLLIFFILAVVGVSVGVGMYKGIIDSSPEINIDSIVPQGFATTVYDREGNLTDTLVTAGSNRDPATFDELPKDLINAFVAIEDSRFWTHNGIDLRSIARMIKGVITGDSSAGGGSTITQQLIKNNVFGGGREKSFGETVERKLQEQYLAVKLSKTMSKELILTNYLNTINLGNNALGVTFVVALFGALVIGWIHNRFHNRLVKVVFELVSTALVYWFLGPVVFLYAALMIGDTLKNAKQKDSILSGIGYSVCILVLTIAWILLTTQTLQYPLYRILAGLNYYRYPGAISPLPFVVMVWAVVIPFLGMIPCHRKSLQKLQQSKVVIVLSYVLVIVASWFGIKASFDEMTYDLIDYDFLVRTEQWDKIIGEVLQVERSRIGLTLAIRN